MNIRVDLNYPIRDGSEVVFRSPVDCSQVTGLIVYHSGGSQEFMFADAHGNNVGDIAHLFAENAVVKVILDMATSMAFIQNADTNSYLEQRMVVNIQDSAGNYSLVQSYGVEDAHWTSTNKHSQEVKSSAQLDEETGNFLTGAYAKNAIALNGKSQAKGYRSFASGTKTLALGDTSHTEGSETIAVGNHSHAEGTRTYAGGDMSHAEGFHSRANGSISHAEGYGTIAEGYHSHVQGMYNIADTANVYSHIVGNGSSDTARSNAHTIDWNGNAWFSGQLRVGGKSYEEGKVLSTKEYVDGKRVTAGQLAGSSLGAYATAEGYRNSASGNYSHVEGFTSMAIGNFSHAEGVGTKAEGEASHAEGVYTTTTADGMYSHAEGAYTTANGQSSHAEGERTEAKGFFSHTEGVGTKAEGEASHAEGAYTTANGKHSHSEGYTTKVNGWYSHAEGYLTEVNGGYSHAEGASTIATGYYQHVQGKYNIEDKSNKYAHIVGNGNNSNRSNAHTIDWDGNGAFAGSVSSTTGADYAEYFEWLDGNTNNEDRVGLVVTLDGEKIRLATSEDTYILGIVSGTACVVGDTAEWEWCGKYITDDFGRIVTESVELLEEDVDAETGEIVKVSVGFRDIPVINPNYDKASEYISRENRPEWEIVGLFGKLYARDDGTCEVNKYAKVGNDGQLTSSEEKTNMRVLRRVSDNVIRVLLK